MNTKKIAGWSERREGGEGQKKEIIQPNCMMPCAPGSGGHCPAKTATPTATRTFTKTITPAGGNGLKGDYYSDNNFTNLNFSRTDADVNFNWGFNSPGGSIGVDNFSVRWTGYVQPRFSEICTFCSTHDDQVRLYVNGTKIIDAGYEAGVEHCGSIAMVEGNRVPIRLDFIEATGAANVNLSWSSPMQIKEIVPQSQLFPGSPTPTPTFTATKTYTRTATKTPTNTATPGFNPPSGQACPERFSRVSFLND